jgi:hypothetical protein
MWQDEDFVLSSEKMRDDSRTFRGEKGNDVADCSREG